MLTVLIIEDEEQLRKTLRQILERANYKVLEAADGIEGVEMFKAHNPEIVLTDIDLPKQDGIQTLFKLRGESSQSHVIAMTGVPEYGEKFLEVAKQLGAGTVLPKPFDSKRLLEVIRGLDA
ncbi:MAG: response regulator [Bdellovibrionales bacterium]|nr:response regulator [Bdellovibrionales bacterium]